MEVGDALPGSLALIDHQSVAIVEFEHLGDRSGRVEQVGMVANLRHFRDPRNLGTRNDQHMNRGHRLNVAKGDALVVLPNDIGGDFAVDDLGEEGGHDVVYLTPISRTTVADF